MGHVRKVFYLTLSLIALIVNVVVTFGVSAAIIHKCGPWALLLNFLWMTLGTVVILGFSAYMVRYPRIAKHLAFEPKRFETPFWHHVHAKGMFLMTMLATWIGSPVIAASILRAFAIREGRAWTYALASNAIVSTAGIALYHGGAGVIRSIFNLHGS